MTPKDKYNKTADQDDQDSSGATGAGGHIEFRDFLGTSDYRRDDLLPASEKKRLLSVHKDTHEWRVKKQKETRDVRKALKSGKISLQTYRRGLGLGGQGGAGMSSGFRAHPALKDKAQFSGIDRQENMLPTENMSATNEEQRKELQNRLENRLSNDLQPKFNPRPHFG